MVKVAKGKSNFLGDFSSSQKLLFNVTQEESVIKNRVIESSVGALLDQDSSEGINYLTSLKYKIMNDF